MWVVGLWLKFSLAANYVKVIKSSAVWIIASLTVFPTSPNHSFALICSSLFDNVRICGKESSQLTHCFWVWMVQKSIRHCIVFMICGTCLQGAVPRGNATKDNIAKLGLKDGEVVYKCPKCVSIKPERAHHCRSVSHLYQHQTWTRAS